MNSISLIRTPIEAELKEFQRIFEAAMTHVDDLLGQIFQGLSDHKGKLMRPTLVLLVSKGWGEINQSSYYSALTLELLHNASLIHDDIVDDSDQRRGQPSVRSLYGNKVAVLAGDYLLSTSLESASLSGNIEIIREVALLGKKLSEGEIIQLTNTQHQDFSEETYFRVIRLKTASLFSTAALLGAISAHQPAEVIKQMETLGEIIGLCFQIRDDIFDYYDQNIGKPTGNDMLEGKLTLPALYALNSTSRPDMIHIATRVKEGQATTAEIAQLVDFTKQSGGIQYAQKYMQDLSAKAKKIVQTIPNPDIRQALCHYIDFVSDRTI